jgi:hypothetical protein
MHVPARFGSGSREGDKGLCDGRVMLYIYRKKKAWEVLAKFIAESHSDQAKETVARRIAQDSVRQRLSQTSGRQGWIKIRRRRSELVRGPKMTRWTSKGVDGNRRG